MMLVVLLLATALVGCGGDYPAASSPVRPQPSPQAQADYQRALGQFAAREGKEERGWIESIMSFATSGLGFSGKHSKHFNLIPRTLGAFGRIGRNDIFENSRTYFDLTNNAFKLSQFFCQTIRERTGSDVRLLVSSS